jgi:hypothetical protein
LALLHFLSIILCRTQDLAERKRKGNMEDKRGRREKVSSSIYRSLYLSRGTWNRQNAEMDTKATVLLLTDKAPGPFLSAGS